MLNNGSFEVLKPDYSPDYISKNQWVVSTFYKFEIISDVRKLKLLLQSYCERVGIKGTIILANEGINGTVSGSRIAVNMFYKFIAEVCKFPLLFKESLHSLHPFDKLKIHHKPEIVSLYEKECAYSPGQYIEPSLWDDFISQDDVIVIDTRNDYEYNMGTFENSINPNTEKFSEFKEWVKINLGDKSLKIASFCTGGVRCEKSTSWLNSEGYSNLYHLKGGIIGYFIETKNKNNKWKGDCFVFDNREAINPKLEAL